MPLEIDGLKYLLASPDFEAFQRTESATGMTIIQLALTWQDLDLRRLQALLYAALWKAQPDITLDRVASLITFRNTATIVAALVLACFGDEVELAEIPDLAKDSK